jgi:hypothetical protein
MKGCYQDYEWKLDLLKDAGELSGLEGIQGPGPWHSLPRILQLPRLVAVKKLKANDTWPAKKRLKKEQHLTQFHRVIFP